MTQLQDPIDRLTKFSYTTSRVEKTTATIDHQYFPDPHTNTDREEEDTQ